MAALEPRFEKLWRGLTAAVVLILLLAAFQPARVGKAQQQLYNTAFLTDAQLEDYNAMSAAEIRAFLELWQSYFRQPVNDVDGQVFDAAEVIYQAAQQYRINPRVILATLEKEHTGVTRTTRPSDIQMSFLMGCGSTNTARQQLACAAERFRSYQDRLTQTGASPSGWQVGVAKNTQDGVAVTPATNAVAGQFTYTPYAGAQWGGSQPNVGGVYLFYASWEKFGFGAGGAAPATAPAALPPQTAAYRVGIQAGHYKENPPATQGGAAACDKSFFESDINAAVANQTIELLRQAGVQADFLEGRPDAVAGYSGDAFVALHTDFCAGANTGFKTARWDGNRGTGLNGSGDAADQLVNALWTEYGAATGLPEDHASGHFTDGMVWYYALNPAGGVNPATPAAIIEMGWLSGDGAFMTSADGQHRMAQGIANAILRFLNATPPTPRSSNTATTLVLDVSGSMENPWRGGIKLESAKAAANQVINMLAQDSQVGGQVHRVGVVSFSDDAYQDLPLTADFNTAGGVINNLTSRDRTNIGAGLAVANETLLGAAPAEQKIIILLSDGMTNVGLSPDEILAGPVQEAVRAGTCIYTIGFGEPGDLDEVLLRNIAQASGCGEYYYATDLSQLEKVYITIRHQSTGTILAELNGSVAQGQTVQAGTVVVPPNQSQIAISLHWPGSKMQLVLRDPSGTVVDPNSANVKLTAYANLVYALIMQPVPGSWTVEVFGEEIAQPSEAFDVIVSGRAGPVIPATPTPQPTPTPRPEISSSTGGFPAALVILLLGGGGVAIYVYAQVLKRKRGAQGSAAGAPGAARLTIRNGPRAGVAIPLSGDALMIGRSRQSHIHLPDQQVSRQHALLRWAQGGWFIQDQGSSTGLYINGRPVAAARLQDGDCIRAGETEMVFSIGGRQ